MLDWSYHIFDWLCNLSPWPVKLAFTFAFFFFAAGIATMVLSSPLLLLKSFGILDWIGAGVGCGIGSAILPTITLMRS